MIITSKTFTFLLTTPVAPPVQPEQQKAPKKQKKEKKGEGKKPVIELDHSESSVQATIASTICVS